MKIIVTLLLAVLAQAAFARDLYLQSQPAWRPKTYSFDSYLSAVSTDSNYTDVGGEFEKLPQNAEFQSVRWLNRIHYNWLPSLSIYAGPEVTYSMASNANTDRSDTQLTGSRFGLDHIFYRGWARGVFNLDTFLSFSRLDKTDYKKIMTQDYASFLHPKIHLFKKYRKSTLSIFGGLYLPTEGYARLVTWGANADYRLQSFTLGGSLLGQVVIQKDSLTDVSNQRINKTAGSNLGSAYYGALNPQNLEGQIWAQFSIAKQARLKLGATKTLNGRNDANTVGGFLSYQYDFISFGNSGNDTSKVSNDNKVQDEKFEPEPLKIDSDAFDQDVKYDDEGDPLKETEKILEKKNR